MSNKKKKSKKIEQSSEHDAAELNDHLTGQLAAGEDAPVNDDTGTEMAESTHSSDEVAEPSPDDILDDVRRSLIEEDQAAEDQKQSKWWRRIGRGTSRSEVSVDEPKATEEAYPSIDDSAEIEEEIDELKDELESEEYLEQIDELIELLDEEPVDTALVATASEVPPLVEEVRPEPEKPVDLGELKRQAFQPRNTADVTETLSEVRSIALEGEEEVFVEVESKPQDPLDERLQSVENALKPYRRYINFAIAFLGVVIAGIALTIIYNVYQRSQPEPVVEQVSTLPFPTSVSLPGGWSFALGKGALADGKWRPRGAEWLQGTEVCRWVSLPWSRQLEAVLRTLNPDDPIELQMSNSDRLIYKVYSIEQMSLDDMQALDSNTPCLLIMLAQDDVEKRWVLTALP
jgi:hypothetical protein